MRYFEIEFAKSVELNDDKFIDTPTRPSICILGEDCPTIEEATKFCKKDMELFECDCVVSVDELSSEEAHAFYDMEREAAYPVFKSAAAKTVVFDEREQ